MSSIMQDESTERGLKRPLDLPPCSMSAFLQPAEGGNRHEKLPLTNKRACAPAARPCSLELKELYEVIDGDDDDDCTLEANSKKELLISEMVRSLEVVIGINNAAGEQPPSSSSSSSSSPPSPRSSSFTSASSSAQLNSSRNTRGEALYELNRRGATSTFVPSCNSEESSSSTPSCSSQLDSSDEYSSTFAHHEQHDLDIHSDINAIDHVEIRQLLAEADYHQELFGTLNYNPCYTASQPHMLSLDHVGIYSFDDPVTLDYYL